MKIEWNGFEGEQFEFEGREAAIIFPKEKEKNGNWTLKTEYRNAFPGVETELLNKGFHACYVKNFSRVAPKIDCDVKARFVKYISETYGLRDKCVPVGMSCGGAHAVRFAGFYPELVACMYIDAPVLNFASWPGIDPDKNKTVWDLEFLKAYPDMKRYKLAGFSEHPINMADTLVKNKIRIVMVYGEEDRTVEWCENGKLLEEAYEGTDLMTVIRLYGRGHHPHGMVLGNGVNDNSAIVDNILNMCKLSEEN